MSASAKLQAAAIEALQAAPGIGGVYDGPPLQAAFPYAMVECGPEADWSHKSGTGREVRLAVTIRDAGERPARLHRLMAEAEAAIGAQGVSPEGWALVTFVFRRSQALRDAKGIWTGLLEYRARMLVSAPSE
jgi:hypothetical protein